MVPSLACSFSIDEGGFDSYCYLLHCSRSSCLADTLDARSHCDSHVHSIKWELKQYPLKMLEVQGNVRSENNVHWNQMEP